MFPFFCGTGCTYKEEKQETITRLRSRIANLKAEVG
jgi:hypothetical protein